MSLFDHSFFRQLEGLRLWSRGPAEGLPWGEARGKRAGLGGEFADHRRYTPGDDLRHVDWPAYWRLRKPYLKLSEAREERPLYLALDATPSMGFGEPPRWDYARRTAAALGFVALASGESVRLILWAREPEIVVRQATKAAQLRLLCSALEQAKLREPGDLSRGLASLVDVCPGRGRILLLSDFLAPDLPGEGLARLAATRHEVALLQLLDPWELRPTLSGPWELEDAETGEIVPFPGTEEARKAYQVRIRDRLRALRELAARRGLRYLLATTQRPEVATVRRLLQRIRL